MKKIPAEPILPTEPLYHYISQRGVMPGAKKLEQFRAALRLRATPQLGAQENNGDEALVHVKLFDPTGSATWYLTEWDGEDQVFSWVEGMAYPEYGYASLEELAFTPGRMGIGIEIDTHFLPTAIGPFKNKITC